MLTNRSSKIIWRSPSFTNTKRLKRASPGFCTNFSTGTLKNCPLGFFFEILRASQRTLLRFYSRFYRFNHLPRTKLPYFMLATVLEWLWLFDSAVLLTWNALKQGSQSNAFQKADERPTRHVQQLEGRATAPGADGSCKEAKNVDESVHGESFF